MGKRELLLIAAFVVAGVIVYQATAPPPEPGTRGFSLSRLLDHLRREVRGNRASAEITRTSTHPVGPAVTEVRFLSGFSEVTITGEARDDIAIDMRVVSNGPDEAEARRWAEAARLTVDAAATSIAFRTIYTREGRQRGFFTVKVPRRLAVRIDQPSTNTEVSHVASLELLAARGDTIIEQVPGRVVLSHSGGRLVVEDVGSLKLNARRSEATLTTVRGDLSLELQNSEVTARAVLGPVSVESRSSAVVFEKIDRAQGPLRVNAVGGSVALRGIVTETRVDGRNTGIDIELAKPAPVTVYNEGDEPIDVTPPPGGYTLDALATHARISVPEGALAVDDGESEQRVNAAVKGGGPAIMLRSNRGPINIRGR